MLTGEQATNQANKDARRGTTNRTSRNGRREGDAEIQNRAPLYEVSIKGGYLEKKKKNAHVQEHD